ncbi:transcriptional regulator, LacI family protein [Vibrio ichthyoenteri ATCC 700023]|uniref:Transcriptional regulator, LacI family protein n=1 Tax=Vibrio ichthyoenteri ATCC 700023 TaxID=870968 RepID=F9S734_9VIBR|nr:LacI family DNA-binding transcriptional regulator [Vibrio ichthyoenteri]EGU32014.1 transcriptional regulator, LacI family protein [Vibrio ichthyoenteri ATCC 700023]
MTVRDIAKESGVSIATVSRVINNSGTVSEVARRSVEAAIAKLDYHKPEPKKKKATKLFAVIVRNMSNPFFSKLIDVLEEEAYKHGRSILLFNSRNNLKLEQTFLEECKHHRVDGVFLIPRSLKEQHISLLQNMPFPVILLTATSPLCLSIGTHHNHGGRLVAQHFIQQSYQRIGFIGSSNQQSDRFIGFQKTLLSHNKALSAERILTPYTTESLKQFVQLQILDTDAPLEAIFCSDDISASHLHNLLNHSDLNQQVEIIGFDDTYIAQSLGFSSVHQPMHQIALRGFELMLDALKYGHTTKSESNPSLEHLLEPTLVLRSSPTIAIQERLYEILKETE